MTSGNPVAVRRLWPHPSDVDEPGAVLTLPADEAVTLIEAGRVFPVLLPTGEPIASGPLASVIRSRLEYDPEHRGLEAAVRLYARRWRAGRLLQVALPLPRLLRLADYTVEAILEPAAGWYSEPPRWEAGVRDPKAYTWPVTWGGDGPRC